MPWIAKPSGTTQIPRRDEPYVTPAMAKRWKAELLPRYETTMGALLPVLHDVQHEHGHIPYQAMLEVAEVLGLAPADVLDTASFYEEFRTEPVGKHVIGVCQSIACEVCGHQALFDHLREKLDVEAHETTDDGTFTLLAMECLGACEGAPCALIDDKRYDNLTIEELDRLLEELAG